MDMKIEKREFYDVSNGRIMIENPDVMVYHFLPFLAYISGDIEFRKVEYTATGRYRKLIFRIYIDVPFYNSSKRLIELNPVTK